MEQIVFYPFTYDVTLVLKNASNGEVVFMMIHDEFNLIYVSI
tara:strand:+ start:500 stop:625 length:126 start_codon:yes stop_codon:yes gene_type:complete